MAKHTVVTLIDDIDGSEAAESVRFSLDAHSYLIDLSDKNAKKLRDALATYIAHARRESGARSARTSTGRPASSSAGRNDRQHLQAVRDWARSQGIEVSERGRIAKSTLEAYDNAH